MFPINEDILPPSSFPGPCRAETNPQPVKEDPNSPESLGTKAALDAPKDAEQLKSPAEAPPLPTQSLVDGERELARRKEQERRRLEAVSSPHPCPGAILLFRCR